MVCCVDDPAQGLVIQWCTGARRPREAAAIFGGLCLDPAPGAVGCGEVACGVSGAGTPCAVVDVVRAVTAGSPIA